MEIGYDSLIWTSRVCVRIPEKSLAPSLFYHRGVYRILSNIWEGAFCENCQKVSAINYFNKKLNLKCLIGFLIHLSSSLIVFQEVVLSLSCIYWTEWNQQKCWYRNILFNVFLHRLGIMKQCRSKWFQVNLQSLEICTAHKIRLAINDFLSKCGQIHSFLRICSYLPKKSLMEDFILRGVI